MYKGYIAILECLAAPSDTISITAGAWVWGCGGSLPARPWPRGASSIVPTHPFRSTLHRSEYPTYFGAPATSRCNWRIGQVRANTPTTWHEGCGYDGTRSDGRVGEWGEKRKGVSVMA